MVLMVLQLIGIMMNHFLKQRAVPKAKKVTVADTPDNIWQSKNHINYRVKVIDADFEEDNIRAQIISHDLIQNIGNILEFTCDHFIQKFYLKLGNI